jgi:hypothetical protein
MLVTMNNNSTCHGHDDCRARRKIMVVADNASIDAPFVPDWYAVDPVGGVDYVASVLGATTSGGTLPDPELAVVDEFGNVYAYNDDSFALGLDPMVQFSVPTSGTYFVGVSDVSGSTGTYDLIVDAAGPPVFFGSMPGEIF